MDRDELKGFKRWLDDERTPVRDIMAKRRIVELEIDCIRDPEIRASAHYVLRLIDEELHARICLERLRKQNVFSKRAA